MRKITVLAMITLDGVMQGPGGPKEDTAGNFKYGGWVAPYTDEVYDEVVQAELQPSDYLLGRKTFDIWAGYWPTHGDVWPGINKGMKYVFSKNLKNSEPKIGSWENSEVLKSLKDLKKLKNSNGADLQVWGSSELVQLLLKNDLVDEIKLKIHPIILGKGKKLFNKSAIPSSFTLNEGFVTPSGVIIAYYTRAGKVKTGTVGV